MSRPKEVFLSHASENRRFVDRLAACLGEHGVPVWYSTSAIKTAAQWHDEIGRALRRCDWFVLVLSPSSVDSSWVKRELLFALQDNRFMDRIVPLLYKSCEVAKLSWTLGSIQTVSFCRNHKTAYRELLSTWGIGFKG